MRSCGIDGLHIQVWDLTVPTTRSHISHTPTYTLHTAFPVRRVLWRPGYECELAVVSNADFGTTSNTDALSAVSNVTTASNAGVVAGLVSAISSPRIGTVPIGAGEDGPGMEGRAPSVARDGGSDPIEIWDVRRGYIAKWVVNKSAVEGGITGIFLNIFLLFTCSVKSFDRRHCLCGLARYMGAAPFGDILTVRPATL